MNKKLLLGMGTVVAVTAPIIAVVACGSTPLEKTGTIYQFSGRPKGYDYTDAVIHEIYGSSDYKYSSVKWCYYWKNTEHTGEAIKVYVGSKQVAIVPVGKVITQKPIENN